MWEEVLKTITLVVLPSMVKFVFGPIAGYAAKLHIVSTMLGTITGMMIVVVAFAFFGDFLRNLIHRFFPSKSKKDSQTKIKQIWDKYGMVGVAALTPLLLSPIGGSIIAISFGAPRKKLIVYMLISGICWAIVYCSLIYLLGNQITRYLA
jgi:membrane protein DedA with SNARE-associated domain